MTIREASLPAIAPVLAWRPEWPICVLTAAAWLALPAFDATSSAHATHGRDAARSLAMVTGWTLMSIAMMLPSTLPAVRHVAFNSIRMRRQWAMSLYVAAYLAVWVVFGLVSTTCVDVAIGAGVSRSRLVVCVLAIASAWQLTRTKRRSVMACRRTVPLPPEGWRADAGCVRFGLVQAWRCVVSCWPLMLLMAVLGHDYAVMIVLTIVVLAEQRLSLRRRVIVPFATAFATATLAIVLAA